MHHLTSAFDQLIELVEDARNMSGKARVQHRPEWVDVAAEFM
jgi:hypothetical protein